MAKFRKKPGVIEAMQWDGQSIKAVHDFMGTTNVPWNVFNEAAYIPTLEGLMTASKGDWIIKGVRGEFYPCKPDIFEQAYESAEPKPRPTIEELDRILNSDDSVDIEILPDGSIRAKEN
jgi:hypothetical protein